MKEYWLSWLRAAGIRAVRTFVEAALAYIGTSATVFVKSSILSYLSA